MPIRLSAKRPMMMLLIIWLGLAVISLGLYSLKEVDDDTSLRFLLDWFHLDSERTISTEMLGASLLVGALLICLRDHIDVEIHFE